MRWKYKSEKRFLTYTLQLHAMENKRVCRTIEEKYKIIRAYEAIKDNFGTKTAICRQFNPRGLSTLKKILENYKISAVTERKRMQNSPFPEIDKQFYQ